MISYNACKRNPTTQDTATWQHVCSAQSLTSSGRKKLSVSYDYETMRNNSYYMHNIDNMGLQQSVTGMVAGMQVTINFITA